MEKETGSSPVEPTPYEKTRELMRRLVAVPKQQAIPKSRDEQTETRHQEAKTKVSGE